MSRVLRYQLAAEQGPNHILIGGGKIIHASQAPQAGRINIWYVGGDPVTRSTSPATTVAVVYSGYEIPDGFKHVSSFKDHEDEEVHIFVAGKKRQKIENKRWQQ